MLAGSADRTLIFEAHQDTVPTDNMTIDPFAARIEDGRLYGRGACDIKGGMAAMLGRLRPAGARQAGRRRCASSWPAPSMRSTPFSACSAWPRATSAALRRSGRRRRRRADPTAHRRHAQGRGPLGSDHDRPLLPQLAAGTWASTPSIAWPACCRTSSTTPRSCEPRAAIRVLGPPTLSVGPHRRRHQRQHRAGPLPHRDRSPPAARRERSAALEHLHDYLRRHVDPSLAFSFSAPWLSAPALSPDGSAELVAPLGAAIDARDRHASGAGGALRHRRLAARRVPAFPRWCSVPATSPALTPAMNGCRSTKSSKPARFSIGWRAVDEHIPVCLRNRLN